jgi:hypothetical protein
MGYRSEVGAIVSVDMTGKEVITLKMDDGSERESFKWFHTDADKALFKELVGKMKLILGHWVDESFKDELGWYDCRIVLHCPYSKWYPDYEDVKAWGRFWSMAQDMEGVSGVFARSGEEDGDLEHEEFGNMPDYEHCHTVQSVAFDYTTDRRDTSEEGQTTQDAVDKS